MSIYRVAILDDHQAVSDAFAIALGAYENIRIVGKAARCDDLIRIAHTQKPDVVLLDYELLGATGIDCLDMLRSEGINARCLLLISRESSDVEFRAIEAGFERVLTKRQPLDVLARAITVPMVTGRLGRVESPTRLSRRQREVLELMGQGLDPASIAETLFISVHTARSHVKDVLRIMGASTQLSAVVKAIREGMLLPPSRYDRLAS